MSHSEYSQRGPDPDRTDEAFEDQETFEELVEIDENGNVYKPGEAPRGPHKKPTILRDPEGEYGVAYNGPVSNKP